MFNPILPFVMFIAFSAGGMDTPVLQEKGSNDKNEQVMERAVLEKQFAELLTGSALLGNFTIDGQATDKLPKPDRYQLTRVRKLRDDYWLFLGHYAGKPLPPLAIRVLWAGNKPVLTMDTLTIPVLGTFSFHILIDGNRYAGTWQHDQVGGHMWGLIQKVEQDAKELPGTSDK